MDFAARLIYTGRPTEIAQLALPKNSGWASWAVLLVFLWKSIRQQNLNCYSCMVYRSSSGPISGKI